jgi:hypothetical protein
MILVLSNGLANSDTTGQMTAMLNVFKLISLMDTSI